MHSFINQYYVDDFSFVDNPVPANTAVTKTINFERTYKTSPIVLASLGFVSDNAMYGMVSVSAKNGTTTSFDLTIFNASNEDKFPIIYYTVIERY